MTLGQIAKQLNRPVVYLSGLQARFGLPVLQGDGYSEAYEQFLRTIVFLRTLNVPEDTIHELWILERALLAVLNADSTGSYRTHELRKTASRTPMLRTPNHA